MRLLFHLALHIFVPYLVARWVFGPRWKKAWIIFLLTMLVDLDHLFSSPVFDPNRCSIGTHPLHSLYAIGFYFALAAWPRARPVAIGLLIHMALDAIDCLLM